MTRKKNVYDIKDDFMYYLDSMENGNLKAYIEKRVIGQIKWYDKKSSKNQFWYKICMIISIIMSACIPVLTLMLDLPHGIIIKIIISTLSSSITGISAIIALYNYRELWVQYRTNCEILKSTLFRFFTRSGEFKELEDTKVYDVLITSCENYIVKEFETWGSIKINQSNSDSNISK